jgi:hypothetical protein
VVAVAVRLLLFASVALPLAVRAAAVTRTETREPCARADPLRNVYFGDLHVHTALSFDASALGVRARPRDAYRFARGEPIGLRPYDEHGAGQRHAQLARPLDFAVVTDHAELLGETHICHSPGAPGYESLICRLVRRWPLLAYIFVNGRMLNVSDPVRYSFCGPGGAACRDAARIPWREIRDAAEEAYDRTSACRFTSFVGYEWSGNPDSSMIHRNVVFRNHVVPDYPFSYVDDPRAEGLWRALQADCLDRHDGCDVLTIPHNSNLSGGRLFSVETADGRPIGRDDALQRAAMEPLVEVLQHKGDSECRLAAASADELCGFEKLPFATMDQQPFPFLWAQPPLRSFIREALGEGLALEARLGANPFKYGLIASTDAHMGTPGYVDEQDFLGHAAGGDTAALAIPDMPDVIEFNPGGLAALWAEENSRDALFEAMRRREAYGTSGPRITVRLFGGWDYPADLCTRTDFVAQGYRNGVPMGGDLPPVDTLSREGEGDAIDPAPLSRPHPDPLRPGSGQALPRGRGSLTGPTFALWALRDPGTPSRPGTQLQRLQVIKIWLDGDTPRERVYDVAGDARGGARVNPSTCEQSGKGFDQLCTVWRDPEFRPDAAALYYARVVENPSCRWSAYVCNAHRVDCADPGSVPTDLAGCCDPGYPRVIQERAWTSPIWYRPPGPPSPARESAGVREME